MAVCIKHKKKMKKKILEFSHTQHTFISLSILRITCILSTPKHLFVSLQAHCTHNCKLWQDFTHASNSSRSTWYYSTVHVIKKRKHIVCTSNKI